MSENLDLVRRAFEAFNTSNLDTLVELCDPAVELDVVTGAIVGREGPYRGHAGLRSYLEDAARVWTELQMTAREVHHVEPDAVVIVGRVYARGSGRIVDSPTGWLWRLRRDLIASVRVYPNPDDALAAAGHPRD